MVYGRILFNNIKEYTPKGFPTIPYSQTVKPTFTRQAQVVSKWNAKPFVKQGWRLLNKAFYENTWIYHIFLFGLTFTFWASFYYPVLWAYQTNNKHRGFQAAITKEKAHKKKLRDLEKAQEDAEATASGGEASAESE